MRRKWLILHQQRSPPGSECKNAYLRTLERQTSTFEHGAEKEGSNEEDLLRESEEDYFGETQLYDEENFERDVDVDDDLHVADDSAQDVAGRMYDDSLLNPPEDTWAGTRILPDGLEENELEVHDENFYFLDADMPEQTEYSES